MPESGLVWPRSSAISSDGFAVLAFAAAFACVSLLDHVLKAAAPVSLFLCAIIFVAWFAGLGPALLASALSVLAFGYSYLLPINSLTLASSDLPRIVLFGVASLIVASVGATQRRTAASLRRARAVRLRAACFGPQEPQRAAAARECRTQDGRTEDPRG